MPVFRNDGLVSVNVLLIQHAVGLPLRLVPCPLELLDSWPWQLGHLILLVAMISFTERHSSFCCLFWPVCVQVCVKEADDACMRAYFAGPQPSNPKSFACLLVATHPIRSGLVWSVCRFTSVVCLGRKFEKPGLPLLLLLICSPPFAVNIYLPSPVVASSSSTYY